MLSLKKISAKAWHSPTLMTWMSYSTKALSLFGILPLILRRFIPGDIVIWYLFSTIISLQSIIDFGFRATFSRLISYAFAGAADIGIFKQVSGEIVTKEIDKVEQGPNIILLNSIISCMKHIYKWLTVLFFVSLVIFGTWAMIEPVKNASNISHTWLSWGIILLTSCVNFYGKIYLNFLEGLFKIALVRRIETLTSLGSILTSILVMMFSPSILNLVIANQLWVIIVTVRDWYLCTIVEGRLYNKVCGLLPFEKDIFLKVWKPAWKSGVSGLMSVGLTNLTGFVYAQTGNSMDVAAYLLALRIINQIKDISMAPFYSKLPVLARLRVTNDLPSLITVSRRGMFLSHLVFVLSFVSMGIFSGWVFKVIHSHVNFVSAWMWTLLGIAFFIHRYGAMHIQIYLSTNHIISHIADGVSGILYIVSALILSKFIGLYAIPVGMLIGYLGFYAWFAAIYSYKSINVGFWSYEKKALGIPGAILLFYIGSLLIADYIKK